MHANILSTTTPAPTAPADAPVSKGALWTGRIVSGVVTFLLVLDGAAKLARPAPVLQSFAELGYPDGVAVGLGLVLIACAVLYAIPRTAALGAILLTGYLGGAVATHVRVGDAPFSMAFPVILGAIVWGGLFLRSPRLRAALLDPLRTSSPAV